MSKFIWYDLMTPDIAKSKDFYAHVVGWKIEDSGMPGMNYNVLKAGDIDVGGMMQTPPDMMEGAKDRPWMGHVYVDSADAAAEKAKTLGGNRCHHLTAGPSEHRHPPQPLPQREGLFFGAINPQREAVVGGGAHVNVSHIIACQNGLCFFLDLVVLHDDARAIDDTVVLAIATQDAAYPNAFAFGKKVVIDIGFTGFGVDEDGAYFGIGLRFGEGSVGKGEVGFILFHQPQAMAAGNAIAI